MHGCKIFYDMYGSMIIVRNNNNNIILLYLLESLHNKEVISNANSVPFFELLWFLDYFNNIKRYNIDSDIQKDVIDYLVHISLRRTCLFYLSAYLLYEVFKL